MSSCRHDIWHHVPGVYYGSGCLAKSASDRHRSGEPFIHLGHRTRKTNGHNNRSRLDSLKYKLRLLNVN